MPLDAMPGGDEPRGPWCTSCNMLIGANERSVRVHFNNDPHGFRGFTGEYHEACSKPFASMARVINLDWFGKF